MPQSSSLNINLLTHPFIVHYDDSSFKNRYHDIVKIFGSCLNIGFPKRIRGTQRIIGFISNIRKLQNINYGTIYLDDSVCWRMNGDHGRTIKHEHYLVIRVVRHP